jgi:hypothetical protein
MEQNITFSLLYTLITQMEVAVSDLRRKSQNTDEQKGIEMALQAMEATLLASLPSSLYSKLDEKLRSQTFDECYANEIKRFRRKLGGDVTAEDEMNTLHDAYQRVGECSTQEE